MVQSNRNQTVDLIRIVAAYGVVAIHVTTSTPAAESLARFFTIFCVPFFYVAALSYFIVGLKPSFSLRDTLQKLWWRLVVPYLAWTIIYFLLLLAKKLMVGQTINFEYWKIIIYGNSAVQLYFLPQLMMMQLLVTSLFLLTTMSVKKVLQGISLMILIIIFLVVGYENHCFGMTSLDGLFTYILGAFYIASFIKSRYTSTGYLIIGLLIFIIVIIREFIKLPFNYSPILRFLPVGGIGLMLVATCINISQVHKAVSLIAGVSFGIYLCHVLFLESFELIAPKIWKAGITYNFITKISVALLLFVLSALFSLFINRYAISRRLLLGKYT